MKILNISTCIFFLSILSTLNVKAEIDFKNSISNFPTNFKRFFSISEENQNKDYQFSGYATPTVYYIPVIDENNMFCESNQKIQIWGLDNETKKVSPTLKICNRSFNNCMMQGSCFITFNNTDYPINFYGSKNKKQVFTQYPIDVCPFGLGARSVCLDPYKSVAADLDIYPIGTVLYFPSLKGLFYGMDQRHDGYMIVRDKGGGINGSGRFDFFTGYTPWKREDNYFTKIGLSDKKRKFAFYVVKGPKAEKILKERNYPGVPNFDYSRSKLIK